MGIWIFNDKKSYLCSNSITTSFDFICVCSFSIEQSCLPETDNNVGNIVSKRVDN